MDNAKEIDRTESIKQIDAGVTNKFRWEWMTLKDTNGDYYSSYIKKLNVPGVAICKWCGDHRLNYGKQGKGSLTSHSRSGTHREKRNTLITNQSLSSSFSATQDALDGKRQCSNPMPASTSVGGQCSNNGCGIPYGAAENIPHGQGCNHQPQMKPVAVAISDRITHAEASTISFVAEHSLSLSVVPDLIKYAQEMARDPKALSSLHMERTTASYKIRNGLGAVLHRRLVNDLRSVPFSMNVDECMNASQQKVFSIIVSYFSDEERCTVFRHYKSVTMTKVDSESLYKCIIDALAEDEIPLANLISMLSDSVHYMRGKISGVETRLRETAPHMLNIDGDVCHHVHNIVKKFCEPFDCYIEKLADDLCNDFRWSPDMREHFQEICCLLGKNCHVPKRRLSHRWLSVFDVTETNLSMMSALTVFYWVWLPDNEHYLYKDVYQEIISSFSPEARALLNEIHSKLNGKNKGMTKEGKKRKKDIVDKIYYKREKTLLLMGFYVDLLPLFKSFILMFEQKQPMVHRLHKEQVDLVKKFLACFIKPEELKSFSLMELSKLDVTVAHLQLPSHLIYVGPKAEIVFKSIGHVHLVGEFREIVKKAYIATGCYMLKKFPLDNKLLKNLSAIDPKAQGHSLTFEALIDLATNFPTVLKDEDIPGYKEECRALQMDDSLPNTELNGQDRRADHWWQDVFQTQKYPLVSKLVKACLSICTGPHIEQSFSIMKDIIKNKTNRLDIQTYAAIMAIKYDLKAKGTTTLEMYHRDDVKMDPVDKGACYYIQTSYRRHINRQKKEREKREKKQKALKLALPKKSKKQTIHAKAARISKLIKERALKNRKRKSKSSALVSRPPAKKVKKKSKSTSH